MKSILAVFACLTLIIGCEPKKEQSKFSSEAIVVKHNIDHIILAINNLDSGMAQFERLTGIKPVFGGQHPGRGSHNALVSFGETTYLEIIAPRLDIDSTEAEYSNYLLEYETLTPIGWAVTSSDTTSSRNALIDLDFPVSGFESGGRDKPNGEKLAWTTFGIEEEIPGLPFFIHWHAGTAHPATTSPEGGTLNGVTIQSPDHQYLSKLTKGLDLLVNVIAGEETTIRLVIDVDGRMVEFE